MPKISHSLRNRFSLLAMCLFFAFDGLSSGISPTTHQMQLPLAGDRKGLLPVGRRQPAFWTWTHILLSNRWDPTFHLWIKDFTSMTIKVLATCKHSSSDHHGSDLLLLLQKKKVTKPRPATFWKWVTSPSPEQKVTLCYQMTGCMGEDFICQTCNLLEY